MKKITFIISCLAVLVAVSVSGRPTKEFDQEKAMLTVVENEGVLFVLDSFFTDYLDGAYERTYHYYNEKGKMILTEAHWWDAQGDIEGGSRYVRE